MSLAEARAALQRGRCDDAIAAYRAALAQAPGVADTWLELGGALKRAGRAGEAESLDRGLLTRAPDYVPARLTLSALLVEQQRFAEAEAVARDGLPFPAPPQLAGVLHNNLGLALRGLRRPAEAL
jgi:tetratricopeptide (TPR) repeat protein